MSEIDRQIAIVKGWESHPTNKRFFIQEINGRRIIRSILNWSKDIALAWELVEELSDKYHFVLKTPFEPGFGFHAGFTPHGMTGWNGRPDFRANANTAPEAICLAYLKVMETNSGNKLETNHPSEKND